MVELWERIEQFLKSRHPDQFKAIKKPATPAAIAKAEKILGRKFPTAMVETYRRHNGQKAAGNAVFGWWEFLSLDRVLEEWKLMKKLLDEGTFGDFRCESKDRKVTTKYWWNIAWIPFASNGAGDLLCLDMAPGTKGKVGQVVRFVHDDAYRTVEADDFRSWLERFLTDLLDEYEPAKKTTEKATVPPNMNRIIALVGQNITHPEVVAFCQDYPLTKTKLDDFGNVMFCLSHQQFGFELHHNKKGRIETAFLHTVAEESCHPFTGELIYKLKPANGRTDVRKVLGKPTMSGESWDRFDSATVCIHFSYHKGIRGIRLITIMTPDTAP